MQRKQGTILNILEMNADPRMVNLIIKQIQLIITTVFLVLPAGIEVKERKIFVNLCRFNIYSLNKNYIN